MLKELKEIKQTLINNNENNAELIKELKEINRNLRSGGG